MVAKTLVPKTFRFWLVAGAVALIAAAGFATQHREFQLPLVGADQTLAFSTTQGRFLGAEPRPVAGEFQKSTSTMMPPGWAARSIASSPVVEEQVWHRLPMATVKTDGTPLMPHSAAECHEADRAYLGITYLPVTEAVARLFGVQGVGGALITAVEPNSPADRAGLRPNDVIVDFGGVPIRPDNTLVALQLQRRAGDSVILTLLRQNEQREVNVTLGSMDIN